MIRPQVLGLPTEPARRGGAPPNVLGRGGQEAAQGEALRPSCTLPSPPCAMPSPPCTMPSPPALSFLYPACSNTQTPQPAQDGLQPSQSQRPPSSPFPFEPGPQGTEAEERLAADLEAVREDFTLHIEPLVSPRGGRCLAIGPSPTCPSRTCFLPLPSCLPAPAASDSCPSCISGE